MPSLWASPCLRLLGLSIAALTAVACSTFAPGAAPPEADPEFDSPIPYPQRLDAIYANSSRQDFYEALGKVELKAAPGARFGYSNAGAQLAGYVVERVYGADYETLLRRHIAAPLDMRDTVIELTPAQAARLAPGHEGGIIQPQESSNKRHNGHVSVSL